MCPCCARALMRFYVEVSPLGRRGWRLCLHFSCGTSALRTDLYTWFMELRWTEINWSADRYPTLQKRLRGASYLTIRRIVYSKVAFNNHKSGSVSKQQFCDSFGQYCLSWNERIPFSRRNWKRSPLLFWTSGWQSFVNENSSKSQRCFPSLLSLMG